jgi:sigma-B regulation protein RsbU (phosphoserine phosphatase)
MPRGPQSDGDTVPPGRLLVVDDNEMNRDLLSRRLLRKGHEVEQATNGREALEALAAAPFDVVLLDIMMPEMDGIEVLERMRADPRLRRTRVIMISAVDATESITRCLQLGADDFVPKPFNPVLLQARINASLARKRLHDQEQAQLEALERELEIGRRIQAGFLPRELPTQPGWELAAHFAPARQVAGDFYDAFRLGTEPNDPLVLVVGDVCDKGVGAALFMALFRSLTRITLQPRFAEESAPRTPGPDDDGAQAALQRSIRLLNDYIADVHGDANMFATMFLAILDPTRGDLRFVNGGHEPPVITSPDGSQRRLSPTGPAAGLLPGSPFDVGTDRLAPEETLLVFTDGVSEAQDADGQLFGEAAILRLATEAESATALLENLTSAVASHAAGVEPSDDVTLLAVRRLDARG